MWRKLQKSYILPRKWAKQRAMKVNTMQKKDNETVIAKREEMEMKLHDLKRRGQTKEAQETQGFINALDWLCQELNEYNQ